MMVRVMVLVGVMMLVAGCQCHCLAPEGMRGAAEERDWVWADLYFGMTRRDSSVIEEGEFRRFVDGTVTAAFPEGFTVTAATGQYLDSKKVLHREGSRVVTIVYPRGQRREVEGKIRKIGEAYCREFDQESVLRVEAPARAEFMSGGK